ncbi:MAG TPA: hypothetical protein VIP11_11405, partial [Gemmatimonadaceae bacterium]
WISGARTLADRLIVSEDAFYYMAEKLTECLLFSDPELVRIGDAMEEIERAHGLREGEYWRIDEAPEEWRALDSEWNRRADTLVDATLREFGHGDVADLRARDRDEYDARCDRGQIDVWGDEEEDESDV